jgi:hypothetical protein
VAAKTKSFSELLSEAPLSTAEETVTLAGALGRSSQAGKFVLTMGPGNSVTLDQSAVKNYQVLGGGVGQLLVQVEVDKTKVPAEVAQQAAAPFTVATPHHAAGANVGLTPIVSDHTYTIAINDVSHTNVLVDSMTNVLVDSLHTNPIADIYHTGGFPHPD